MPLAMLALFKRVLTWIVGVSASALLLACGVTDRFDNAFYDLHMRHWSYQASDKVVIVAIDPQSLAKLGSWPLPRSIHAKLIERLTDAGVRGIGVDIAMAEPDVDHPENDHAFAQAIHRNGRVVMPVFAEATELGGVLEEMLPTAVIAEDAASFGHVDASKDADGVTRGVYLKAGLGQPQWPALALAVYNIGMPTPLRRLPGLRSPEEQGNSPYQWMRDNYVLIRFAGASGRFDQVSYIDVLEGRVPEALLKGRWVLVGATAAGLGDRLQTSASSAIDPMPGVEYQANILESLQSGKLLTPLNLLSQLLFCSVVIALPLLIEGLPGFRRIWLVALLTVIAAPVLSVLLLRYGGVWCGPACAVLVVSTGLGIHMALRRLSQRRESDVPEHFSIESIWR
jgi:adenylate cyclase